jgi:hypothetical protein
MEHIKTFLGLFGMYVRRVCLYLHLSVNVSPPETDVMFFKKLGDNIFWQFLQKDNHKIGF